VLGQVDMTFKTLVVATLFTVAVPAAALQPTDYERLLERERAEKALASQEPAAAVTETPSVDADGNEVLQGSDAGERRQMVAGPSSSASKPPAAVNPNRVVAKPPVQTASAPGKSKSPKPQPSKPASQALNSLQFGYNSSELQPAARAYLDREAASIIADGSGSMLLIVGHSSRKGDYASNQALSESRAFAVRDYLISKGVPSARLRAEGHSYRDLLPGIPPADERNRRVEYTRVK
jgi:outer membrane protein OmpA-like peptidoglycan-associated protein